MLALVLGDIHGRTKNIEGMIRLIHNRDVDLVLITGDLTSLGGAKQAEEVLKYFEGFRVLAVAGNFDTSEANNLLERKGISLHAKSRQFGEWGIAGFGGGLFGGPGSLLFSEGQIEKGLSGLLQGKGKEILVTHLPPFGTGVDLARSGAHIGSRAVRKVIEEKQPLVHLCGHCHEAFGEEKIGRTTSINVGSVSEGRALLLKLGRKPEWERLQL